MNVPAVTTRRLLAVEGADALRYLQGQLSADLNRLAIGDSAWSLLLEPSGKLGTLLRVCRAAEERFELDGELDAPIEARLRRFLIRTKATLTLGTIMVDVSGTGAGRPLVGWWGESTHHVVTSASDAGGPTAPGDSASDEASAAEREADRLRVAAGWPGVGELLEGVIPAETGVLASSVSFTKGCYTGQELVARIDSRSGSTPRNLRAVVLTAPAVVGDTVEVDGASVGTLTSVAGLRGLAYIARRVDTLPCAAAVNARAATIVEQRS